jgi:hypothetical protein
MFDQLTRTKRGRRQLSNLMDKLSEATHRTKRKFDSATEDGDFPRRWAYYDLHSDLSELHTDVFEALYPQYAKGADLLAS